MDINYVTVPFFTCDNLFDIVCRICAAAVSGTTIPADRTYEVIMCARVYLPRWGEWVLASSGSEQSLIKANMCAWMDAHKLPRMLKNLLEDAQVRINLSGNWKMDQLKMLVDNMGEQVKMELNP